MSDLPCTRRGTTPRRIGGGNQVRICREWELSQHLRPFSAALLSTRALVGHAGDRNLAFADTNNCARGTRRDAPNNKCDASSNSYLEITVSICLRIRGYESHYSESGVASKGGIYFHRVL